MLGINKSVLSQICWFEYNGTMKKIAIVGYKGKMGGLIFEALKNEYSLIGVDKNDDIGQFSALDLVVDFANADSSVSSAEYCLKNHVPIIIGSTGQSAEQLERLNEISKHILLIKRANFSRGIEAMKQAIDKIMPLSPEKIEIIEKHHIHKKDAPSGTALELKSYIQKNYSKDIIIKSIREGDEKGEHLVEFYFGSEKISIKHNVYSRTAFVEGVVFEINKIFNGK